MTLQEFLLKWNGKYCEVAGSSNALNQCVDLCNLYIRDVLGLPIIEWTDAKDFPSKAGDNFEWIPNTLFNIPQEGDLIVWKTNHIAIFLEGNVLRFTSFDQNYPTGKVCFVTEHSYINVSGWLRYKKPQSLPEDFGMLVKKSTQWDSTVIYLEIPKDPKDTLFEDARSVIGGFKSQIVTLQNQKSVAEQEAQNRTEQAERYKQSAEESATQVLAYQKALADKDSTSEKLVESLQGSITKLNEQVDTISKEKGRTLNELALCKAGQQKTENLILVFIDWIKSILPKNAKT